MACGLLGTVESMGGVSVVTDCPLDVTHLMGPVIMMSIGHGIAYGPVC